VIGVAENLGGGVTRCEVCGVELPPRSGPGRPARYCAPVHRQEAFRARSSLAARAAVRAEHGRRATGVARRLVAERWNEGALHNVLAALSPAVLRDVAEAFGVGVQGPFGDPGAPGSSTDLPAARSTTAPHRVDTGMARRRPVKVRRAGD
jgi:hypothetical protein